MGGGEDAHEIHQFKAGLRLIAGLFHHEKTAPGIRRRFEIESSEEGAQGVGTSEIVLRIREAIW